MPVPRGPREAAPDDRTKVSGYKSDVQVSISRVH